MMQDDAGNMLADTLRIKVLLRERIKGGTDGFEFVYEALRNRLNQENRVKAQNQKVEKEKQGIRNFNPLFQEIPKLETVEHLGSNLDERGDALSRNISLQTRRGGW